MQFHLVVTSPFGRYAVGDLLTDATSIDEALQSHGEQVVRVAARPTSSPPASSPPASNPAISNTKEG